MPDALPIAIRQQIIELKCKGCTLQSIAQEWHLSYSTVCQVWQRYKAAGSSGLAPHYDKCGPARGPKCAVLIYRAALWLKRGHPDWGAALIRLTLQDRYKNMAVPSERCLQRWFKAQKLYKPKSCFTAVQSPTAASPAQQVHDVWQIDAKEKLCLGSGQRASYLSVVDEKSGCLLKAVVFPLLPHQ